MALVLETLHKSIQGQLQTTKPLSWKTVEPTEDDMDHLEKEAGSVSRFDPLKLKLKTYQDLKEKKARLVVKESEYAKVVAIIYPNTKIPWNLFGKIFQSFSAPVSPPNSKWRILWLANPTERKFSQRGQEPGEANVNGGYTLPCRPDTIVIYRDEEAPRVLVHELLHAACTDDMNDPEHLRESKTESWAELFLIAIQSQTLEKAIQLWNVQARWIVAQEYLLFNEHNVKNPASYAWRYTIGRSSVLEGFGFVLPVAESGESIRNFLQNSLRFTHPLLTQGK